MGVPDDPRPTVPPAAPDVTFEREERPTLVPCVVCDGDYQRTSETDRGYRMTLCRWCTQGGMTPEQREAWNAERREPVVTVPRGALR